MDDYQEKPRTAPIIPEFFIDPVHMTFKSKEAGRPIYEDREFVKMIIPGNRGSVAVQPVDDEIKARWPAEYAAFKAGEAVAMEGTPLAQWPPVSRSQVEEFKFYHVHTVEQLAALNDTQIQNMGMGVRDLQKAARLFLDAAQKGTGPLMKIVAENTRQADQITALQKTVGEMAAKLKELSSARAE